MRAQPCPTCGRPADPAGPCPHCGASADDFASELARIEREIADIAAKDVEYQKQRTLLSKKMQAAMHRKALLANAQDERVRVTRQKRPGRRRPVPVPPTQRRPPQAPPEPPVEPPPPKPKVRLKRERRRERVVPPPAEPPPAEPFSDGAPPPPHGHSAQPVRQEASTRSV
jgi:hypothetical protein